MSGNASRQEESAEVVVEVLPKKDPEKESTRGKEMGSKDSDIEQKARAIDIQSDEDYQTA